MRSSVSSLRPRWWTPELERRLQAHLARGGGLGRLSLASGLGLNQFQARILSCILSRPPWMTDELIAFAKAHPHLGWRSLAKRFGLSNTHAQILHEYVCAIPAPSISQAEVSVEEEEKRATLYLREGEKMPSPAEILKELGLDPAVWEIVSARVERGHWEMGRRAEKTELRFDGRAIYGEKEDTGEINVQGLYRWRVTVHLRPRRQVMELKEAITSLIEEARAHAPHYPPIDRPPPPPTGRHMFLVGLYDLHIGKLAWAPEAGQNYDLHIAESLALEAVEGLIARVKGFGYIEQVVLPLGGDILHIDNAGGTTTAGTPQDYDGRWQKVFSTARRLIIGIIDRLLTLAPVHVVVIPGNHDATVSYFLGETLAAWYHRHPDVTIDNEPTVRRFLRWRGVLLWFHHGHKGKPPDWFADMANYAGPAWHECRVREGILGHIHHEKVIEYKGVTFRNLRSLSATDAWHASNFFNGNIRGLQGLLYHETLGPYVSIPYYVWESEGKS